jgi:hypothetical protein
VRSLLRADLLRRSGGYCEVGGERFRDTWAVHHRQLRSHQGKDVLENLMAVCHGHHNLATRSIHLQPTISVFSGWIVPSHLDPAQVPIRLHARAMSDDSLTLDSLLVFNGPWYLIRGTEYVHYEKET